ncbi:MAG: hypothetical protein HYR62_04955 [Actinobacteria bacterium]|nr:hypothetical protein [Actinomycetota bacterium]
MYSLVSAPVLGFDIARMPGGSAVAELLLRGISLVADDLPPLAVRLPDARVRTELWAEVEVAGRRQTTVRDLTTDGLAGSLAVLQRAPIGTLDGLLHCLRHDVLDWTWQQADGRATQTEEAGRAAAVLADAVAAAYLRDLLPATVRRMLAGGWVAASRRLPVRPVELGPQQPAVDSLLARVRGLRPHGADAALLARAVDTVSGSADGWSGWGAAMHSASWAVQLSGRRRPAASAQLALVQALDTANVPTADRAAGGWNLLSGAVHATVVQDVLDADSVDRLVEPYHAVFGPLTAS